jgi:choice-of-anchor C domain-containing protein
VVASNNSDRSAAYTNKGELANFVSASSALTTANNQHVQELYDVGTWRQARIDLGNWAGSTNLRLRFDFTTAGEFDVTQRDADGNPVNDISGYAGTTGLFSGDETTGAQARGANNTFEGFYVDDVIIGYAERGEMVTGVTKTTANTNFFDIVTPAAASVPGYTLTQQGLTGPYQLEIRRGTEYGVQALKAQSDVAVTRTFDTNEDLVASRGYLGDGNQPREQGQFLIENNTVSDASLYGISIDAAAREAGTNNAVPGTPRNLPVLNASRLVPGVVVTNNVIAGSGTGGILFSGEKLQPLGSELVSNGSFEQTSAALNLPNTGFVTQQGATTLVGWKLVAGSIDIKKAGVFPARTNLPAAEGSFFVDTSGDGAGVLEQELLTEIGETYTVQFAMAGNPDNAPKAKSLRVSRIGDTTISATFTQDTTPISDGRYQWERKAWTFVADATTTKLRFESLEQNQSGIFLDDVSVRPGTISPSASVPFGRIVNNTIYGGATPQGTGIAVTESAGPTLLNNLFANLAKGVDVDASSQANTVIGGSAYHDVATQVAGATQSQQITLTTNPFVNAAARNFYLAAGSGAIDSSVNSLVDRPAIVAVTSPLGVPQSPILAPERDRFGQLRGDEPTQASAPGLGSNVFKDRGAIDRVDFTQPAAQLAVPLDNSPSDKNTSPNGVRLEKADARNVTRFEIQLDDFGVGIDRTTVKPEAFDFRRDGATLPTSAYFFNYLESTNRVVFESTSVYAAGTYEITVKRTSGSSGTNVIVDLAGNPLLPNKGDGTTSFRIELADVPTVPAGLTATTGSGQVALAWAAATSDGTPLLRYEVQRSTVDTFDVGATTNTDVLPPSLDLTAQPLVNGTPYWFRVRAWNAIGESDWSNVVRAVPLQRPVISGMTDDVAPVTGNVANGGATNDPTPTLTGTAAPGTSIEIFRNAVSIATVPVDVSGNWFFTPSSPLADGSYTFTATADAGPGTAVSSLAYIVVVDTVAPTVASFSSTTAAGAYKAGGTINVRATMAEAVQAGASFVATLNTGATVTLTAASAGTVLSGTYTVAAGQNAANLAVTSFTAGSVLDVAGNPMTATALPATNLPAGIVVDTVAPTVASFGSTTAAGVYKAGGVINIRATMAEAVQAGASFVATLNTGATVTLTAASAGTVLSGTYTIAAGQNAANLAVTSFTAGSVLDVAGNPMTAITMPATNLPAGIVVDTVAPNSPTLALGTDVAGGATAAEATQLGGVVMVTGENGSTVTVTFTRGTNVVTKTLTGTGSSQAVVLTAADLTKLGNGTITVSARQTDRAGNPQTAAAATTTFLLDTVVPTITITSSRPSLQLGQTALITFTLSEPSTSFIASDVSVTGGTLTGFTGSGSSYSATFTPTLNSTLSGTVVVAAGAFTDASGNGNTAGSLVTPITIDRTIRASAVGFTTTPSGPAYTTTVTRIPITFNAPVTGFTLASLKLFYQDRPVSLVGATLTGSGANYVLTLPRTTASLRGRYRLDIGGPGTGIVSGGVPMSTKTSIYWQRI